MNYRKIYLSLMEKGRSENGSVLSVYNTKDGYENHHKIPLTWGGNNHRCNLIRLTYRQHYVAHRLLSRVMGTRFNKIGSHSHEYERIRKQVIQALRLATGTPEARERASRSAREHNSKNKRGVIMSKANREQRSATLKAKSYTCPHCGKVGGGGLLRWHFDNCNHKPL